LRKYRLYIRLYLSLDENGAVDIHMDFIEQASRSGERILIVGGCGFVGQALSAHLTSLENVRAVCVLDMAPCPSALLDLPNLRYRKGDITDLNAVIECFEVRAAALTLSETCRAVSSYSTCSFLDFT
jgi:3-beta hydroxysteroid dehydrogenase/isomerase family